MNYTTLFLQRFLWSNVLTVYYSGITLFLFLVNYLKNPFSNPWTRKLRLDRPTCLLDPRYGVHKYLKCNNTKLHYVESGDPSKPLMIFLHGFPEFWYSWRHQIVEFNNDYWCIAIDMRGYGDSEKPEGKSSYKMSIIVDDVRDLVRQLGREKCVLVAHDWGSVIACKFRDTYPHVLNGIVILGGASIESLVDEMWSNPRQFKKSWYIFLFHCPWIPEKLIQMNDLEFFERTMMVKGKDSVTQEDVECYKYWFGKPMSLTPPLNYYRANFTYTIPEKKRCELPVPFLAIGAAKDVYLGAGILDRMKEHYACIETTILENCRHFLQQEEPKLVNATIREFLNKYRI